VILLENKTLLGYNSLFDSESFPMCPVCNERIEIEVNGMRVSTQCKCAQERFKRMEDEWHKENDLLIVNQRLREAFSNPRYLEYTFALDNGKQPRAMRVSMNYVNEWKKVFKLNAAPMYIGGVGVGKTYAACASVIELISRWKISAWFTSFREIITQMESAGFGDERDKIYERLRVVDLLILDDIGTLYETKYTNEMVYTITNERTKPLMTTTNLTPKQLMNATEISHRRVYDRIIGKSIPIVMEGSSQRIENAQQLYTQFKDIMEL
jgi:DNA replication protein DnaC